MSTLDAQLSATTSELEASEAAVDKAEVADSRAADAVSAFRPRFELQTLQQRWSELADADAALPGLLTDLEDAETALGTADTRAP